MQFKISCQNKIHCEKQNVTAHCNYLVLDAIILNKHCSIFKLMSGLFISILARALTVYSTVKVNGDKQEEEADEVVLY